MKDTNIFNKSKESLLKEIERLNKRVFELEKIEQEKRIIEQSLKERSKELNCLYGLSQLIERYGPSIDRVLQGVTELVPLSWQYPSITSARILFDNLEFTSHNFRVSKWKQETDILVDGQQIGKIQVYYNKRMPKIYEGPFLKEERMLIDALSERISRFAERINAQDQLEMEKTALNNMNITLREVLARVQNEKREIGDSIYANYNKVILPLIHAIETDSQSKQKRHISLLKSNLEDLISPFVNKLSKDFMSLTPSEIQICNMIREGLSSKEISNLRSLSTATINKHRENIRKKLGLTNKAVNLATFLNSYMET
jgi:DNA-binding CsgD family transcriptional regulator